MSESLSDSFKRFVQMNDSVKNEASACLYECVIESLINSKMQNHSVMKQHCVAQRCVTVIFVWNSCCNQIEQKQSTLTILNYCMLPLPPLDTLTHTHTHTHACSHTPAHTHPHTHTHSRTHTHTHAWSQTHTHTHTHVCDRWLSDGSVVE